MYHLHSIKFVDRFRHGAENPKHTIGGTSVFPLTRQRLKFATVCLCTTLLLVVFQQTTCGQENDDDAATTVNLPVDDWTPPEWYTKPEQDREIRSTMLQYKQDLKAQNPTPAQRKSLQALGLYWLSQVAWPENRADTPHKVTNRFLQELLSVNSRTGARIAMMDEMLTKAPDLLKHPSDVVRTNTVLLVSQFSIEPADFKGETPAPPYNPAYKFLLTVLQDANLDIATRIAAANGLVRFCRDGKNTPNTNERAEIGGALIGTLQSVPPDTDPGIAWFRQRMVEALGYVGRIDNVAGKPVVLEELMSVLRNKKETWENRSEAALALTHLELNSSVNVPLITHEICSFLQSMIDSKAFAGAPGNNLWVRTFSRVYLAFRPRDQREADLNYGLLNQVNRVGLGTHRQYVQDAFAASLPILEAILSDTTGKPVIPQNALNTFTGWLGTNIPTDRRLIPNGDPID